MTSEIFQNDNSITVHLGKNMSSDRSGLKLRMHILLDNCPIPFFFSEKFYVPIFLNMIFFLIIEKNMSHWNRTSHFFVFTHTHRQTYILQQKSVYVYFRAYSWIKIQNYSKIILCCTLNNTVLWIVSENVFFFFANQKSLPQHTLSQRQVHTSLYCSCLSTPLGLVVT